MPEVLSIPGYSTVEYNNVAENTKITQSNYPFSRGVQVSIRGWYIVELMNACSHVVCRWHLKGTHKFNNSL